MMTTAMVVLKRPTLPSSGQSFPVCHEPSSPYPQQQLQRPQRGWVVSAVPVRHERRIRLPSLSVALCLALSAPAAMSQSGSDLAAVPFEQLVKREVVTGSTLARQISDSPSAPPRTFAPMAIAPSAT